MEVTFTRATAPDVELLTALMRELYAHDRTAFDEREARRALELIIGDHTLGGVWLIACGGEAIGYLVLTLGFSLEFHGRDAFVDELYVRPSHRGRGAGREALTLLEAECRARGVHALHLEVDDRNERARVLYGRWGFGERGNRLMTKWLAPPGEDTARMDDG